MKPDDLRRIVWARIGTTRLAVLQLIPREFAAIAEDHPPIVGIPAYWTEVDKAIYIWPRKEAGVSIEWERY